MIKIQCIKTIRRGGIEHPQGMTCYPEDRFSDDALKLIEDEPRLMVQKGLPPEGPDTMSVPELKEALKKAGVEFYETDPRGLLASRLVTVKDKPEPEPAGEETKSKKKAAE